MVNLNQLYLSYNIVFQLFSCDTLNKNVDLQQILVQVTYPDLPPQCLLGFSLSDKFLHS